MVSYVSDNLYEVGTAAREKCGTSSLAPNRARQYLVPPSNRARQYVVTPPNRARQYVVPRALLVPPNRARQYVVTRPNRARQYVVPCALLTYHSCDELRPAASHR